MNGSPDLFATCDSNLFDKPGIDGGSFVVQVRAADVLMRTFWSLGPMLLGRLRGGH
jgi:hypothetical protein